MANYLAEGNKRIYCKLGNEHIVPFQQTTCACTNTTCTCTDCGHMLFVKFFGTVIDKDGNYVY